MYDNQSPSYTCQLIHDTLFLDMYDKQVDDKIMITYVKNKFNVCLMDSKKIFLSFKDFHSTNKYKGTKHDCR